MARIVNILVGIILKLMGSVLQKISDRDTPGNRRGVAIPRNRLAFDGSAFECLNGGQDAGKVKTNASASKTNDRNRFAAHERLDKARADAQPPCDHLQVGQA